MNRSSWHGGKGDARRKEADQRAYEKGWDAIFNKSKEKPKPPKKKEPEVT